MKEDYSIGAGSWNGNGFSGYNHDWIQRVNQKWQEREDHLHLSETDSSYEVKELTDGFGRVLAYQVLKDGKLDEAKTKELNEVFLKENSEEAKAYLLGLLNQWALNNGKDIVDALLGEHTPSWDIQRRPNYSQGVNTENILSLVQAGAEYIGGGLWFFSNGTVAIAGTPASGGASLALVPEAVAATSLVWAHATRVSGNALYSIANGSGGSYSPTKKKVNNMDEFFDSDFGSELKGKATKTKKKVDGQSVYKVDKKTENLKPRDQFYLDGLHKDHLEVFDNHGKLKSVLNLDGSINIDKTKKAFGRKLK